MTKDNEVLVGYQAVRFHHWPDLRLTMAVSLLADGNIAIGLAHAGRRDQWSRKKGRLIAEGRARVRHDPPPKPGEPPKPRHWYVIPNADLVDLETQNVRWRDLVVFLGITHHVADGHDRRLIAQVAAEQLLATARP